MVTNIFSKFSKIFQNFQVFAKMLSEYQQTIFIEFSKFSKASQNIARIPTKYFFQIFQNFKCSPKCYQNGNKFFFLKILQNFRALAKILSEWQHFYFFKFFKISSDRQNVTKMETFDQVQKILKCIMLPFLQHSATT